jgi:hypothetical protein
MSLRKIAVSCLLAGAALTATCGTAFADEPPVTTMGWYVAAVYPNTPQGWRDCGNATVNVYKGHCKLDSESSAWVFLWAWR